MTSRRARRASATTKPWGHELIWALTDRYCGKVIAIEAGRRLSLQRHERKDESVLILSGRLQLHLEDDDGVVQVLDLGPGESRHIPPHRIHRFEAQRTASSSSRSRRPSSTTSSASRTTTAARARRPPDAARTPVIGAPRSEAWPAGTGDPYRVG